MADMAELGTASQQLKAHVAGLSIQRQQYLEFAVRAIALKKSGVGGLCWLIRPA